MESNTPQNTESTQKPFKVSKSVRLSEGAHTGTVVSVEFRTPPEHKYNYTDLYIAVDNWEFDGDNGKELGQLKAGVATNFTENAQLVQLMVAFGKQVKIDDEFTEEEVKNVFVGKKVKFVVFDKAGKDKQGRPATYSNIVQGSLKCI